MLGAHEICLKIRQNSQVNVSSLCVVIFLALCWYYLLPDIFLIDLCSCLSICFFIYWIFYLLFTPRLMYFIILWITLYTLDTYFSLFYINWIIALCYFLFCYFVIVIIIIFFYFYFFKSFWLLILTKRKMH